MQKKTQNLLVSSIAKLDEDKTLSLVKQSIAQGINSYDILEEARKGLEKVGASYSKGEYFLADLIMAAEIFKQTQHLVLGTLGNETIDANPQIIFGTAQEDIHDIGKNISISMMRSRGLRVIDLGVNVSPEKFVETVQITGAPILCISGLITQAYESMKKTILLLDKQGLKKQTIVIIGGLVNSDISKHLGSDYWINDATSGLDLCKNILQNKGLDSYNTMPS